MNNDPGHGWAKFILWFFKLVSYLLLFLAGAILHGFRALKLHNGENIEELSFEFDEYAIGGIVLAGMNMWTVYFFWFFSFWINMDYPKYKFLYIL